MCVTYFCLLCRITITVLFGYVCLASERAHFYFFFEKCFVFPVAKLSYVYSGLVKTLHITLHIPSMIRIICPYHIIRKFSHFLFNYILSYSRNYVKKGGQGQKSLPITIDPGLASNPRYKR